MHIKNYHPQTLIGVPVKEYLTRRGIALCWAIIIYGAKSTEAFLNDDEKNFIKKHDKHHIVHFMMFLY